MRCLSSLGVAPRVRHTPAKVIIEALTHGTDTKRLEMIPMHATVSAANGTASCSVAASAAVPRPCDDPAVASPRVMGSLNPSLVRSACCRARPAPHPARRPQGSCS